MRAPDDLPRRRSRRRSGGSGTRRRVILIVAAVMLFFLLTSLRGIAGLYTDYLWFDSLGQWGTRRTVLGAQFTLAMIFIVAFFLLAWSNLYVAERLAPPFRPAGPEDELLERYHDLVAGRMGRVRVGVAGLLALIAGSGASAEWNSWLLFTHSKNFGVDDPQFHRDVGFYVFKLPFLSFVVDWLFASLLIVLIITAVAHYLNGGIRVQSASPRVTSQVKAHLSVLLAVLALVKTADYWLQSMELTTSGRGVVDGATYTDVHAQLPALNLLMLISIAAACLFIGNIFRRGWALPVVAVGLWAFVALTVGGIYPQVVQKFSVEPNQLAKEEEYIHRNINATREAIGLSEVQTADFKPQTDAAAVDLTANAETIRNIRLWDPSSNISGKVFEQLQRIRDYYNINDIDVDRYMIDGQPTQVELGVRTVNSDRVPGESWENQHLAYTHGYGAVLAPSNASEGGEPNFLVRDVPVRTPGAALSVDQPQIYFGEDLSGYAMVNTGRREIDYQAEDETKSTVYKGDDGVKIDSMPRRLAFALRFWDPNPLISDYINGDSRVIYNRDVVDRVKALAPFLSSDADPYPVMLDGKVLWVIDMYTTTSRYPYAQSANTDDVLGSSGLHHKFNYVRNSVKATVDAYDGTVNFYVMDVDDPIIDAYRDAFPDLFQDQSDMPNGLDEHLRYPEDLFRVQTSTWERYHLTDPQAFFNQDDGWRVARDPGTSGEVKDTTPTTTDTSTTTGRATEDAITPYYQLLQLPGEESAEFVLMRPFVPFSEDDTRMQLRAFMAARMDPGHYGELMVYKLPSGDLPDGPGLVAGNIGATRDVSETETLLGGTGSTVLRGNLLLLPVGDTLLYVQPMYVQSENANRQIPRLEKVIAVLDDRVVIADTLQEALTQIFGERVATLENPGEPPADGTGEPTSPTEPGAGTPTGSAAEQAATLLADADALFKKADEALANGDLAGYQDNVDAGRAKMADAAELLGEPPATTTTSVPAEGSADGAPTTTTTAPSRPA